MATRNSPGHAALNSGQARCRGGKWFFLLVLCLASLAAWFRGTSVKAQEGSLPPVPPPEKVKPAPAEKVKVDSDLPLWNAEQPEILKPPKDFAKPPIEVLKPPTDMAKIPCPPGQGALAGASSFNQCDQNMPGVACPSAQDLEQEKKHIDHLVDPKNTLTLFNGRTRLMVLKETPTRVQIGDETIVDFALIGPPPPKQLSLLGKKFGTTVLNLWFPDPADKSRELVISYLLRVIQDPEEQIRNDVRYQKLAAEINCAFPDSRICLKLVGDKLVVSGQAKDVAEATQILRIARSNAPRVDDPKLPYNVSVNVDSGAANRDRLRDLVDAAGPYVINLLRIPGEQQVMLKVTVAEVSRTAARSIGMNFTITGNNFQFANNTGNIAGNTAGLGVGAVQGLGMVGNGALNGVNNGVNQMANNLPAIIDNGRVSLAIDALHKLHYARTLAEPTLTTLDGQPASFQAGGQFPIPIVTGATQVGLQGVEFKDFGVQLNFTPYITDRDLVRLSISAAVSTRDLSSGTIINGGVVSGLTTRNFQTTVNLRQGQTLAVAGLIQNNLGGDASRIPFLGDLPIIGRLFGFDQLNAGEQELVFLITPVLVHPLDNAEIPPLPGSDLFEPGDLEFYLLGRLESRRNYDYRSPVRTDIHRMMRYHRCEELYIIGPSGHSEPTGGQPVSGH